MKTKPFDDIELAKAIDEAITLAMTCGRPARINDISAYILLTCWRWYTHEGLRSFLSSQPERWIPTEGAWVLALEREKKRGKQGSKYFAGLDDAYLGMLKRLHAWVDWLEKQGSQKARDVYNVNIYTEKRG